MDILAYQNLGVQMLKALVGYLLKKREYLRLFHCCVHKTITAINKDKSVVTLNMIHQYGGDKIF